MNCDDGGGDDDDAFDEDNDNDDGYDDDNDNDLIILRAIRWWRPQCSTATAMTRPPTNIMLVALR